MRGGVVHGIGATLFEWMRYDEDGQPADRQLWRLSAADAPMACRMIEIQHMESPTPLNPLGVKGAAESGTIAAPAAIVSAVENALAPWGVVSATCR